MIQLQTFKEEFNELPVTRGSLSNKDKELQQHKYSQCYNGVLNVNSIAQICQLQLDIILSKTDYPSG